ncbi:BTB/POZ domain-containing protein KCTD19-like [Oncorhynchus clarkii lewisi]|uniref:BTB/POZ domain-containing protein KCTD19-like n=1 Tax=Oncorhynchus clarkii lewisi TaxID=490388 RepID=UPI0039B96576
MATEQDNQFCSFNVGGCFFSIRFNRLSHLQDSLLFKDTSSGQKPRWFIERDGCTFRHVQYYLHTGKLATSCALENLQSGKHFLRDRPVDLQVTERATLNYWKTRICNTREPDPIASPVSSVHDAVPLGLVGTPLVDGDEEVLYCFVPMETVRLYPALVTPHNLLWLCDDLVVIECDSSLFRFIANYLQTGNIFLPEDFSDHDRLNQEAGAAGMTDFLEELQKRPELIGDDILQPQDGCPQMKQQQQQHQLTPQPLYIMTFDLLVRYQDSALGQLCVDSNVEGSRLHLSGNGVVFQHVENWLGTCRVPLTERQCELPGLCEYLDRQDEAYHTFRDALWEFLHRTRTTGRCFTEGPWSASVATFSIYKVVKVYVGTHWYATYYKTLLKHPELLSNPRKSSWILFGHSLQIRADGAMFRHILNFLRCGHLLLPSVFKEWRLLCHEVEEFQIPALTVLTTGPGVRATRLLPVTSLPLQLSPYSFTTKIKMASRGSVTNRVDHPPVLGRGEPGGYFTQSLIYTASPPHTGQLFFYTASPPHTDVVFACFNVSWEDMVFGRQCHVFLTGLILDSIRLEDSKDCTLKITNLVYFLWTGQVKAEDFVSELLRIICSERREKSREQLLLQWLEFSLPLAQRYSDCLEQLDRGHCRTVSLFP